MAVRNGVYRITSLMQCQVGPGWVNNKCDPLNFSDLNVSCTYIQNLLIQKHLIVFKLIVLVVNASFNVEPFHFGRSPTKYIQINILLEFSGIEMSKMSKQMVLLTKT